MLNPMLRTALLVLMTSLALSGCNVQEAPVPELRILGEPPATATLGSEYFYEWAVDGGEGIPDFTLTNAPRWLSVEWVDNKLRRGIVMRGIPGITGGRTGTGDLTQDTDDKTIILSVTDGDQLVTKSFSISVRDNVVSGTGAEVDEDSGMEQPEDSDGNPIPVCESDASGVWLDAEGKPAPLPDGQSRAYVLMQLKDAPVEPITFHYQRDTGFAETATAGVDFVEQSGYFTFKAGMSQCLLTAAVIQDQDAEPAEVFGYEVDQVVSGLGALKDSLQNASSANPTVQVTILDDEPRIHFEKTTLSGTEGQTVTIRAVLNKAPEQPVSAQFSLDSDLSTVDGNDYAINGAPSNTLSFATGETEKTFTITLADTDDSDKEQDEKLVLRWEACAPSVSLTVCADDSNTEMTLWINEWTRALELSWTDQGVIADTAVDDWGRVYVARNFIRSNGREGAEVLIYDRTGAGPVQVLPFAGGDDRFDARIGRILVKRLSGTGNPAQALWVTGAANARFTSTPTGSAPSLGGWDAVVERYDRVSAVTPVSLIWRIQYGSDQDDFATGLAADLSDNLYVVGHTGGTMEDSQNQGGQDGFILYLTSSGAFNYAVNVGTAGTDTMADAASDSSDAVAFAGYSTGDLDDGPIGGRDAITGTYSKEGRVVRLDQFGSVYHDELLAMGKLSTGFVTTGYTTGSLFEGKTGSGGKDVILVYHKTTSFPDKRVQLGTAADDMGLVAAGRDLDAFVGGKTSGVIASGATVSGATDGWFAHYTADPDEKTLEQDWIRQTGRAGDDWIAGLLPTQQNKVFVVNEVAGENGHTVYIWPVTPEGEDLVSVP